MYTRSHSAIPTCRLECARRVIIGSSKSVVHVWNMVDEQKHTRIEFKNQPILFVAVDDTPNCFALYDDQPSVHIVSFEGLKNCG